MKPNTRWGKVVSAVSVSISIGLAGCGVDGPAPSEVTGIEPGGCLHFTDVTNASGVDFKHHNGRMGTFRYPEIMGGGVALFDADGDGHLDLYLVNGNELASEPSLEIANVLYRNRGDGTFVNVTAAAGLGDTGYGQGVCVADVDNDGDQDLYLTNYGPDRFFVNHGDGVFSDRTGPAGLDNPRWGQSCVFLDMDRDGWLDLYVQNYLEYDLADHQEAHTVIDGERVRDYLTPRVYAGAADQMYRNNGDGTFSDVSDESGIALSGGKGMGAASLDYDCDGSPDVFVANDGAANFMFRNRGDATFEEVGLTAGVATSGTGVMESSMGVDVGDMDGDGRFDLIVPVIRREVFSMYLGLEHGFRDASVERGLARSTSNRTGFSPNLFDGDHDGDLDIFVSCGGVQVNRSMTGGDFADRYGEPDLLLINGGAGDFHDGSGAAGAHFETRRVGRGSAMGDLDNDGDLDLVISNLDDDVVVLRNDLGESCDHESHNWLTIGLAGSRSNRDAIGARVEIQTGGKSQVRLIRGGGSYLSASDRRLHFGLGSSDRVDTVTVLWPSGHRQTIESVAANQYIEIIESP